MQRPHVLILYTGGTFGMDPGAPPKVATMKIPRLSPASLRKRLMERVPELADLARCEVEVLLNRDSAHIGPGDWVAMAEAIQSRWKSYDGVVILHGTDTLAYTASALSFLLRPCLRPVVITGAMRPLSALRSDARRNLISAVEIAASGPRPLVNQVTAFFDDRLFQGNRVRKRSASDFGAFDSPKAAPLALVGTSIVYRAPAESAAPRRARGRSPRLKPSFSRKVATLRVTPGFPAREVQEGLLKRLDALVLVVFPSGTGPTHDPAFMEMLDSAREEGIPVILATEGASAAGGVGTDPRSYAAGQALLKAGCFWAGELTPECAFVKASLILGQSGGKRAFGRLWGAELAGEGRITR